MTLTQILLTLFLIFAISRVVLRFKDGEVSWLALLFWVTLFSLAIIAILLPQITSELAWILGVGRGADAVIYISIVLLFYLVFRLYVYLGDLRHDITELIKEIALKDLPKRHDKKTSKD
ncbi:DUF2304 family protein [Candidatus Gottesmanbacteria bacterium]|nr:DUF2304 family protein [Candidatus Gottesmanbacteria bacterium]